jgi:hypothetical protein
MLCNKFSWESVFKRTKESSFFLSYSTLQVSAVGTTLLYKRWVIHHYGYLRAKMADACNLQICNVSSVSYRKERCVPLWVGRDSSQHSSRPQTSAARLSSGSSLCQRSLPPVCGDGMWELRPLHRATSSIHPRSLAGLYPGASEQNKQSFSDI